MVAVALAAPQHVVDWDGIFDKVWPCLEEKGWGLSDKNDDFPPFYHSPDVTFLTCKIDVTVFESKQSVLRRSFVMYATTDASATPHTSSGDLWDLAWAVLESSNCVSSMCLRNVMVYLGNDVAAEDLALHKTMFESKREAILHFLRLNRIEERQLVEEPKSAHPVSAMMVPDLSQNAAPEPTIPPRRKPGRPRLRADAPICSHAECFNVALNGGMCSRHYKAWKSPIDRDAAAESINPHAPSPSPIILSKNDRQLCTVKGCFNFLRCKGLCKRHYSQERTREGRPARDGSKVIELLDSSNDETHRVGEKKKARRTRRNAVRGKSVDPTTEREPAQNGDESASRPSRGTRLASPS